MVESIRVLHVDEDPDFVHLVARSLEEEDDRLAVTTAHDPAEGLDVLTTNEIDCIVSDHDERGVNGVEFLDTVRERHGDLPFVLYTGRGSEALAGEAISRGVTDYMKKGDGPDRHTVLANRVVDAVETHRDERDRRRRDRRRKHLATLCREASKGIPVEQLLDRAVEAVADRPGTTAAGVFELSDDDPVSPRPVATAGEAVAAVGTEGGSNNAGDGAGDGDDAGAGAGDGDTLVGRALEASEPVTVEGVTASERLPERLTDRGVGAAVCVGIGTRDDRWGVLCGYVSESRSFPPEEVQFVETVANLLGTALEHRETDRHRRESDARFREIAEVSPDTIFRLDVDGTLTYVSPAVGSLLGYDPEDLVGSHFGEHVADGYVEAAVEGFNRVRSGTTVRELEVTLTAADGTRVPSELSASPVHRDGEVAVVQGVVRDISERKAVERAIREANARYRTLVEHFPDGGVFLFDHDLRYTLAGGDELGAVGLSSADFEGTRPANLFPEDIAEETVSHYRKALDGDSHTFEQRYEGSVYRVRTLPIHDDDGEVASGMAVSQNVTDRRRRERELERQNERLSEFASIVSHDLRNPLLVATARLELAEAECESEHLEDVARAHDRMEALIKDLLTLARQGETATDVELLDLPTLVETCWRNVRTERAKLVVETDRRIRAEKGRLEQLLENLIGNAVEHAGDDVTVTVGDLDDGFFFEDDGRGVPDSAREDIFEAGYSTVPKGTGFGLNIVEEVANAHGWTVDLCESAAGGARFEVRDVGPSR